jgi:hypothetical protein
MNPMNPMTSDRIVYHLIPILSFPPDSHSQNGTIYNFAGEHLEKETATERFDRLHHEADQRARIRAKAKGLLQENAYQKFTFQPQINQSEGEEGI